MKVSQASAILCSILCLCFWRRPTEDWASLCSTPFFLSEALDIFTIYWLCRHASSTETNLNFHQKWFWPVWYCGIDEWDLWSMTSKLSLSFTLSFPLENRRLNFLSVQLPPAWMKGSDKTDQDVKVGISNEDRRMNTDSEQSGSSPAGTGEARLLFFCYFCYYYCK